MFPLGLVIFSMVRIVVVELLIYIYLFLIKTIVVFNSSFGSLSSYVKGNDKIYFVLLVSIFRGSLPDTLKFYHYFISNDRSDTKFDLTSFSCCRFLLRDNVTTFLCYFLMVSRMQIHSVLMLYLSTSSNFFLLYPKLFHCIQTTSRRLADRKSAKFQKNITKRGSVPETTVKKGNDYPVGPMVLGFFIFVVIGSCKLWPFTFLFLSV